MHKLCCEGSQCLMKIDYVDVAVSWQNPRVAPSSWKVSITSWWVGKSPIFHITQQKRECHLQQRRFQVMFKVPKNGTFTNPTNYQPNFMAENPRYQPLHFWPSGHIPKPCGAIIGRRCQEPLAILGPAPALKPSRPTSDTPKTNQLGKMVWLLRINGAYLQLFQMNRNAPDGKNDQLVGSVFSGTGFSDEASQMIHASLVS